MSYRGHVENGVVKIDEPVALPEGASVEIDVVNARAEQSNAREGASLYDRLKPIIGIAKGLPPDASLNVDDYLYGQREP